MRTINRSAESLEIERRMLALIDRPEGVSIKELSEHLSDVLNLKAASQRMKRLAKRGVVVRTGKLGHSNNRWFLVGKVPAGSEETPGSYAAHRTAEMKARVDAILQMIARPIGASSREIADALGINPTVARHSLCRLKVAGLAERGAPLGASNTRWFAPGKVPPKPVKAPKPVKQKPAKPVKQKPAKPARQCKPLVLPKGTPKPVKPAGPTGPVIIPPHVRVQVGPSIAYDARFQLPPGARVKGPFSRLGVGRYL